MARSSCTRTAGARAGVERQLDADLALFHAVESGSADTAMRYWETISPTVVLGRHGVPASDVDEAACRADGVEVVRRFSGGGTVVLAAGCLNYAIALSLGSRPQLLDVAASFRFVLGAVATALNVDGLSIEETDLALAGRKVSGSAQRRGRQAFLHHGTLLYAFNAGVAARYLKEPARRPAYRRDRRHEDFLGNIPLSADALRARLDRAWRALGGSTILA